MAFLQPKFAAMAEDEGGGGGMMLMGSVSCTITDEASPFSVIDILRQANQHVTVTFESCSDHAYLVASTDVLASNSTWTYRAAIAPGQDGATSWTDTTTASAEVTARFYRVERLWLSDTVGDGIPDWWRQFYFGTATTTNDTSCASCDPDEDSFSNLSELLAGTSPQNADDHPLYGFSVNGGMNILTNAQLELGFSSDMVADFVVVSESITMANSITGSFVTPLSYTLANTNDGRHTIYVQLLKTSGTLSPVFGHTVELDTHPPTLTITSLSNGVTVASRRINIQGFAADAATNVPALDASRPLQVTVNENFVNERDTNGDWWVGPQDLIPGTNVFVAVATDRAGFSVSNAVWVIYDATLATNVPIFTVDVTNTVVVGSNATTIAVSGTIDDDNATVQIAVVDATDPTITNVVVSAAVHGTNWWGEVPVLPGSNIVVIAAQNVASLPATNGFVAVQDPNVLLEIASPGANTAINFSNVTVVGRASTNFDGTITINGTVALTSSDIGGITFSNTVPINNIDANMIEVNATSSDGSSATTRQIVYGYEIVGYRYHRYDRGQDDNADCWFAHHYPDQYTYRWYVDYAEQWSAPASEISWTWSQHSYGLFGAVIGGWDYSGAYSWNWAAGLPWDYLQHGIGEERFQGVHLNAAVWNGFKLDCPHDHDCDCQNQPYCEGEDTSDCCIDTSFVSSWSPNRQGEVAFIKHWPVDEEQTVMLHFDSLEYWADWAMNWCCGDDPSQITLWGQQGFLYDENTGSIGFLVKIRTNTRYTLRDTDFITPMANPNGSDHFPNSQSTRYQHNSGHILYFDSFANTIVKVKSVDFRGTGNHVLKKQGSGQWRNNLYADVGDTLIDYPEWHDPFGEGAPSVWEPVCYTAGSHPQMNALISIGQPVSFSATLRVKDDNGIVLATQAFDGTGPDIGISNLTWSTALTNAIGQYYPTLTWEISKNDGQSWLPIGKTVIQFMVTLAEPQTGEANTLTARRLDYATKAAQGATTEAGAATNTFVMLKNDTQFALYDAFNCPYAWSIKDSPTLPKGDCITLATLMKYILNLDGVNADTKLLYATTDNNVFDEEQAEFDVDGQPHIATLKFYNVDWNNFEAVCYAGGRYYAVDFLHCDDPLNLLIRFVCPNQTNSSYQAWTYLIGSTRYVISDPLPVPLSVSCPSGPPSGCIQP
jgi:hypothetical protein